MIDNERKKVEMMMDYKEQSKVTKPKKIVSPRRYLEAPKIQFDWKINCMITDKDALFLGEPH